MEKNKNQLFRHQVLITGLSVVLVVIIALAGSYAIFSKTQHGTEYNVVQVGDLELSYVDLSDAGNVLQLASSYPISDSEGEAATPYRFSVENTGTLVANYTIKIIEDSDTITADGCSDKLLDMNYIRYKFDNQASANLIDKVSSTNEKEYIVYSGTLQPFESNIHEIRVWVSENSPNSVLGKHYHGKVVIDIEQGEGSNPYERPTGVNPPRLSPGMIPVTYDEGQQSWVKADTSSEWYNYEAQMWANAVTVTEASRSRYASASAGTTISMDDINTMWVWIPRYSYTIRDTYGVQLEGGATPSQETPGAIDIKFISTDVKDSGSGTCTKCVDNWVTPVGFTFGDEELSGFWIGKFETTGTMSAACTDENCTTADLTIKPSVPSLTNQTISSFFYASRSMQNAANANKYGFDVIGSGTMDVHVGKNTEWGIVAYLSQSKYGKYGNPSYSGADKEVAINNCSNLITGIGGDSVSAAQSTTTCTTNTYETVKGQSASTTGTVYGVYDMSGGAYEYVMGNYNNTRGSSEFSSFPNSKYYDLYTSDSASAGYKAGDATYETSSWYRDDAYFVNSSNPWFHRGGNYFYNTHAGVFSSSSSYAPAYTDCGTRLILKP